MTLPRSRTGFSYHQAQRSAAAPAADTIVCSPWSTSSAKYRFDMVLATAALIVLSPFLLMIAILVRYTSHGPAIFRQQRIGRHGEPFTILKFRTMYSSIEGGNRSSHSDHRITDFGRLLRRFKLDELPQLINVCRGEMSLVGPRPRLHGHSTADSCFRPGISGSATLAFAAEEYLLRNIPAEDLEECHRLLVNPLKTALDLEYMATATVWSDLRILFRTLLCADRLTELDGLEHWQPTVREPAFHPTHPPPQSAELPRLFT